MKTLQYLNRNQLRIIAVSATIPNSIDICEWLKDTNGIPAINISIPNSMRPVALETIIISQPIKENQNMFAFEVSLNFKLPSIISKYSDDRPVLIVQKFFYFISHIFPF